MIDVDVSVTFIVHSKVGEVCKFSNIVHSSELLLVRVEISPIFQIPAFHLF